MAKSSDRFVSIHAEGGAFGASREVWVDRETGVNYLWVASGYGGLTVLLDRDGKPVVSSLPISE